MSYLLLLVDVIGTVDGTHIECKVPTTQHSSYQDRKFNHSIIVQAVATSTRLFTNISVGYLGSLHDARILKESDLGQTMYNRTANLFYNENYHLVGDSAYPCKMWLMTPYRNTGRLTRNQRQHNRRLSVARVCMEHSFGLLKERFRICKFVNANTIAKVVKIVTACCVLHNFCLLNHDQWNVELDPERNEMCYSVQ
ncbi:putative nuclease HARBI1 [Tribolium madens]|uniref:putative nuclease HARBI1 n=1 Tax=Tribolium madens TaxID=41895 RepID=UPI001CF71F26|nr:putative nuclease HARBI1 [Tribolium madens]